MTRLTVAAGSLYISVADTCFVTCKKTKLKAILHYLDEGWVGKAQNKMQGVIYKYDPESDSRTKIKEVPESDIVARLEGCWQEQIYFTRGSKSFDKSVSVRSCCRHGSDDLTDRLTGKAFGGGPCAAVAHPKDHPPRRRPAPKRKPEDVGTCDQFDPEQAVPTGNDREAGD